MNCKFLGRLFFSTNFFPSFGGRGVRGGGLPNAFLHPHPDPFPSREREDR